MCGNKLSLGQKVKIICGDRIRKSTLQFLCFDLGLLKEDKNYSYKELWTLFTKYLDQEGEINE